MNMTRMRKPADSADARCWTHHDELRVLDVGETGHPRATVFFSRFGQIRDRVVILVGFPDLKIVQFVLWEPLRLDSWLVRRMQQNDIVGGAFRRSAGFPRHQIRVSQHQYGCDE